MNPEVSTSPSTILTRRTASLALLVMGLVLSMAAMIIYSVPVNVDESVQYHPIACTAYPNAYYHTFKLKAVVVALRLFPALLRQVHRVLGAIAARRAPTAP